jgi:integrase
MALYKQPNGIYHIRFTLNGKQIARSAKTKNKSIAAQLEAQMRSDALKCALKGYTDRFTVHASLDKYLAEKEHTPSYTTIRTSVKALKEGIADKSLEKLNPHGIQEFVSWRVRNGIKETTITLNLSHLKIIINRMRTLGYDVPDVKFPKAIRKNRLRFLSDSDVDELLHQLMRIVPGEPPAITEYRHDVHDMAVFVLNTGARYSEVTNIQWQDVDLENRTLTLYRKKVDNFGTLPISDELYAVLRRRQRRSGSVFPAGVESARTQ